LNSLCGLLCHKWSVKWSDAFLEIWVPRQLFLGASKSCFINGQPISFQTWTANKTHNPVSLYIKQLPGRIWSVILVREGKFVQLQNVLETLVDTYSSMLDDAMQIPAPHCSPILRGGHQMVANLWNHLHKI
jgi:hypothetical protein